MNSVYVTTSHETPPRWRVRPPLLSQLDIELTERCNNVCLHCCINRPAGDRRARARELSTAQWQDILRQAADLGALAVRFTGGEPLLREDFTDLYLYARRLGLRVVLFTNARRITPALADLLARVPPLEPIEVTVYGMRAASYDASARMPGAYTEFRRGLKRLLASGVPFIVKGAVLPPNRHELEAFEAWAATLPWMDQPPTFVLCPSLRERRDSPSANRRIARLRLAPEEGVAILARPPEAYRRALAPFCRQFLGACGDRLFPCGAGESVCADAYGRLQPCLSLRVPELSYDLKQGSLKKALTDVFPRLRTMRATHPAYLARCARCFLKSLCEQCPARSWSEHGTLDTPVEYYCRVAHAQARALGLLADGERAWEVTDSAARIETMRGFTPSHKDTKP